MSVKDSRGFLHFRGGATPIPSGSVVNASLALTGGTNLTQTYSTAEATHANRTAAALTDNGGGAAADGTIAAINTQRAGYVYYQNVAAATTTAGADQLDIAAATGGETMASIVQPDVPCNVTVNFTDGDAGISAFQLDIVGVAPDGSAASEQFVFGGGLDQTGSVMFASVTSWTLTSITGNGAGDTLDVGYGAKLAVPVPAGSTGLSITKLVANGTTEAASAVDTTNNSFTATTAPDGAKDFEVWFEYTDPGLVTAANAVKELSDQINKLIVDQADTAQFVNALVDQLQARSVIP